MPLPEKNPLTTWLAQVLGPILIMGMVGSLVFFFIEIVYRGPHATRLCWVLGLFTIASVLVSRVSIQEGFERASLFGVALAIATLITSTVIVDFDYGLKIFEPVTIVVLIGVVMWSSSKLTWDCTVVDSSRDVSSSGLLDFAARRFRRSSQAADQNLDSSPGESGSGEKEATAGNSQLGEGVVHRLFSKAGRQNTPGLWVFYFSLFALPVFGMGQWFADSHSRWGDSWIFLLFAVYLGSGLGLLMVTSLLGLNRYLGRRNLPLPLPIAQSWLAIGSLLAVLMMGLVVLVPRPDMAAATSDALAWFSSSTRRASDKALGRDGQQRGPQGNSSVRSEAGKKVPGANAKTAGPQSSNQASQSQSGQGQGRSGSGQKSSSDNRSRGATQQKQGRRSAGERSSGQQSGRSSGSSSGGEEGEKSRSRSDQPAGRSGQRSDDSSGQSGERANQDQRSGDRNRDAGQRGQTDGPPGANRPVPNERKAADQDKGVEEDKEKERDEQQGGQGAEAAEAKPAAAGSTRSTGNPGSLAPPPVPRDLSTGLATAGKALLFLIGLAALVALVWLYRDELAELWAKWFGGKRQATEETETAPEPRERKPDFSDFADPFRTGRGAQWSERQLIQYTYLALEAWARGRQYDKEPDETPYEFARQIQLFDRAVGHQAVELARLYCRSEYSQQRVRRGELKPLLQLWQEMSNRAMASA